MLREKFFPARSVAAGPCRTCHVPEPLAHIVSQPFSPEMEPFDGWSGGVPGAQMCVHECGSRVSVVDVHVSVRMLVVSALGVINIINAVFLPIDVLYSDNTPVDTSVHSTLGGYGGPRLGAYLLPSIRGSGARVEPIALPSFCNRAINLPPPP